MGQRRTTACKWTISPKRRQRQEIFKVEDEIMEKRNQLIESLEKRLAQRTETETLLTIRWVVE